MPCSCLPLALSVSLLGTTQRRHAAALDKSGEGPIVAPLLHRNLILPYFEPNTLPAGNRFLLSTWNPLGFHFVHSYFINIHLLWHNKVHQINPAPSGEHTLPWVLNRALVTGDR
ncbi:hypothetical protein EDB87DRAFT_713123 [Lactarius vividus]|nr:hypothetical protein EDB87DRAFT_713123 [Lactarius vividus]